MPRHGQLAQTQLRISAAEQVKLSAKQNDSRADSE